MKSTILPLLIVISTSILFSQSIENENSTALKLKDKHSIYLVMGFLMNSSTGASVSSSGVKTETNFIGSLNYQYWFDAQWSANVSAGSFNAGADIKYTSISSINVIPILFGFSFYPEALTLGDVGRVYAGINAGMYMASGTKTNLSLINFGSAAVNETVFGAEPHAGIDFFVSRWIKLGPSLSYHLVSEFKEVVGNRKDYSGPVFSINIGVVL